jgi:hypothetical protein
VTAEVNSAPTASSAGHRLAKIVTEVLSPAVIVVLLPFAVAWNATGHRVLPTIVWSVVVAVFYSVLPMAFIVRGARQGQWDGHWVRERERRFLPLMMCLVSALAGLVILLVWDAPRDIIALAWSMVTVLIVCVVITRWWKVSLHATVAGGAVATVMLIYGWIMAVLIPLVALVAWARVKVEDHTAAQVAVGAFLGPVVGGVVFVLLR